MLSAGVAAQAELVRGAATDIEMALDLGHLAVDPAVSLACGTPATGPSGAIGVDVANRSFEFRESSDATGCGLIAGTVAAPAGAGRVRISFAADRHVRQQTSLPIDYVESFTFQAGTRGNQTTDLFDPAAGTAAARTFTADYILEPSFNVSWFFNDRGYSGGNPQLSGLASPGLQQACSARVTRVHLAYDAVPSQVTVVSNGSRDEGEERISSFLASVTLAAAEVGANLTLRVEYAPMATLLQAWGPDGAVLQPTDLAYEQQGAARRLAVLPAATRAHGAGDYRFLLATTAPLPPPPPPPPPTRVPWLLWAALPVPAVAGLFALRGGVDGVRAVAPSFRKAARLALLFVAALGAVYFGAGAVLLFGIGARRMTVLPLAATAVAGYGALALLFIGFLLALQRSHVVAARSAAWQRREQAEALARTNRDLEAFAYVASHDLQEPLRKVTSFSQLLQRRYAKKLGPEGDEFIGHTVEGAKRMQRLIRDLLAYSRAGQEGRPVRRVDLADAARQATEDLAVAIAEAKATIEIAQLPFIKVNETEAQQLFLNLIGNAVKYRHPDRPLIIRVRSETRGPATVVCVEDNGEGIAPEHGERVFQMFQRLHGPEVEGTGMGLALCRKVVEGWGGRIWVESVPGQGATFCFTVPALPSA